MQLPLSFDLAGRRCLLIGAGELATRKARLLGKSAVRIDALAPVPNAIDTTRHRALFSTELLSLVEGSDGKAHAISGKDLLVNIEPLLSACALCIVADETGLLDHAATLAIVELCEKLNCPINVVDQPSLCSFTFPSIVDRQPVSIAIASGGNAPVLARQLREQFETMLPARLGELAELAGSYRPEVSNKVSGPGQRRRFWEQFFSGKIAEHIYAGRASSADESAEQLLGEFAESERGDEAGASSGVDPGEVYLVGAGPGDPELLTLRALRLMQQADIVFYDRLVSDSILERVRRDAERVYVGKQRAKHAVAQPRINELLLEQARKGKRVLRLKGGDPFVFGRGGEELEHLRSAGIDFQVVPGVTAATGCAAYAGIPLTHRDHAQSVRFITGHLKSGELDLPWSEFLQPQQTLVFYMGLVGLPVICEKMMAAGRAAGTPVALIQQGTSDNQRVLVGTLATIAELALVEQIKAPTITIIGDVVRLHEQLRWFDSSKS